ncbi:1,4-alpha-glucan branching enzyme [Paraconexibacter sp. AEG42_29]|uniref:1,4-alpha-glucan branching enzyme n=1 Tax=Paraconexibacter sp. AEG42_29 TaxID=2997339 RepID=A0AAU7AZD1_9ACTN
MSAAGDGPGALAIVLHSHMPYVEGFGTWPFGEEWLFEALATCYLPLLDVLDGPGGDAVTLSLTPVLVDQLSAPGLGERFAAFLKDVRRASHALDVDGCRASGHDDLAAALELAAGDYERALERFGTLTAGDELGVVRALAPHAAWTSSATHAVLPLIATEAGVQLQLRAGIDGHRERFDAARPWRGGFWLPECAHAPWLDPLLEGAGVHATCVDLTDVLGGHGAPGHLTPYRTAAGPLLVPIDRAVMELVWSDGGYPAHGSYRDYHHRTTHDHHPWSVDGSVYDRSRALDRVRTDAAHFVAAARERVAEGGLSVCALDTELLGHWWYEGVDWLAAVLDEARVQGLRIVHLDDALAEFPAADPIDPGTTSWGTPRDLSTWDAPAVADLAWQARSAELAVVAAGPDADPRAVRELLALQSSDWAFMVTRTLAGEYPVERAAGHHTALVDALRSPGSADPAVRSLAPYARAATLLAP